MQQLVLTDRREIRWIEVPEPGLLDARDALVRPLAVALCDIDQQFVCGDMPAGGQVALGHEFVAEIVETGEAVTSVEMGDRVIVPFQISCGECPLCRLGATGNCQAVPPLSMFGFASALGGDWGGALSDLVRVPFADHMVVRVPAGIEPVAVASVSDNLPDAWRTIAPQLERAPRAEVLVIGGGRSIALYAVQIALALGASRVVYRDSDPHRLELAETFGAEVAEGLPKRPSERFPVTVDSSFSEEGLAFALRSTEPDGHCTHTGVLRGPETPLPLYEMYTTGVHFHVGRPMARAVIPHVLNLIEAGRIVPELVTSRVASWDEAAEAAGTPETKLVIVR